MRVLYWPACSPDLSLIKKKKTILHIHAHTHNNVNLKRKCELNMVSDNTRLIECILRSGSQHWGHGAIYDVMWFISRTGNFSEGVNVLTRRGLHNK